MHHLRSTGPWHQSMQALHSKGRPIHCVVKPTVPGCQERTPGTPVTSHLGRRDHAPDRAYSRPAITNRCEQVTDISASGGTTISFSSDSTTTDLDSVTDSDDGNSFLGKLMYLPVNISKIKVMALLDSGSSLNVMSAPMLNAIRQRIVVDLQPNSPATLQCYMMEVEAPITSTSRIYCRYELMGHPFPPPSTLHHRP